MPRFLLEPPKPPMPWPLKWVRTMRLSYWAMPAPTLMVSADRRKVKLLNVIAMMDRWYVRRVVKKDLRTLFNATADGEQGSGRTVTVEPDGTVTLTNTRYKLKYSLKKLHEATE